VLQFVTGNYKQASKTCEELLDRSLTGFEDTTAIKLAFLFIFIQVKLQNTQHPKINTAMAFLEKQIATKAEEAKRMNNAVGSLNKCEA